jgi:hypothetical protein
MGWNFRSTAGFVSDTADCVPMLAEVYPHTYTNANGYSLNAGWVSVAENKVDRASGNDPRLAGIGFGGTRDMQIDLSSGSAPGAADYVVDLAAGDQGGTQTIGLLVKDNTTTFITVPSQSVSAGHFLDATVTDVTASTNWTGTTVNRTFASTTCMITQNSAAIFLAHFRLALASAASSIIPRSLMPPMRAA